MNPMLSPLLIISTLFFVSPMAKAACGIETNKPSYESTQDWQNRSQECVDVNGEFKLVNGRLFRIDGLEMAGSLLTFVKKGSTFNREITNCIRKATGKNEILSTTKTHMLELTLWGECDSANITFGCSDTKSNFEARECVN